MSISSELKEKAIEAGFSVQEALRRLRICFSCQYLDLERRACLLLSCCEKGIITVILSDRCRYHKQPESFS